MKELETDRHGEKESPHGHSRLFLLRVRIERINASDGPEDLAGKVQDPVSGQVQYFRGGTELIRILHRMTSETLYIEFGKR